MLFRSGAKAWITNGSIADVAVVWAKDDAGDIRGFLVERGTKGFETPKIMGKLSLRASVTGEISATAVWAAAGLAAAAAIGLSAALGWRSALVNLVLVVGSLPGALAGNAANGVSAMCAQRRSERVKQSPRFHRPRGQSVMKLPPPPSPRADRRTPRAPSRAPPASPSGHRSRGD